MTDRLRAAAQAILDSWDSGHFFTTGHADRIGSLRAALAEPYADKATEVNSHRIRIDPVTGDVSIGTAGFGKQEPVAWRFQSAVGGWAYGSQPPVGSKYPAYPLYAAPPRREWQTLTEEEWTRLYKDWMDNETTDSYDLMNSVEAALKEKNA